MRLSVYVVLLFSIAVVFWLMGSQSVYDTFKSKYCDQNVAADQNCSYDIQKFLSQIMRSIVTPDSSVDGMPSFIDEMLLTGLVVAAAFLTGFSANYIIPAMIAMYVLNLFVLPVSILFGSGTPEVIVVIFVGIINVIAVLAVANFIRGGAT